MATSNTAQASDGVTEYREHLRRTSTDVCAQVSVNLKNLVEQATVTPQGMLSDAVQITHDRYASSVHASNLVRSIESLQAFLLSLKETALVNDFPARNAVTHERNESLAEQQRQVDASVDSCVDDARSLLHDMEALWSASSFK